MTDTLRVTHQTLVGRVKWFNSTSGFGFITLQEDIPEVVKGSDIFVHHSSIKVSSEQYRYLVQGEYVEFLVVPTTQGPHQFQAINVAGIKGGQLMCETRRELKVARNSYYDEKREDASPPPRKRIVQKRRDDSSPSPSTPRKRVEKTDKVKVRGEGPREGGEWTYVVKNSKPPSDKPSSSAGIKKQRPEKQEKV